MITGWRARPLLRRWAAPTALLVLLGACAGSSPSTDPDAQDPADLMASREPSIRGTITEAGDGSVLVEENPAEESGSAKAFVRLGPATVIRHAGGAAGTPADLATGLSVSVWFVGPVAESYPVQASAGAIRIEDGSSDGQP